MPQVSIGAGKARSPSPLAFCGPAFLALLGLPALSTVPQGLSTTRVSVSSSGAQGDGYSSGPATSSDGQIVAFASKASTLVPGDTNGKTDIFLRNRTTSSTTLVSVASPSGPANGDSAAPSISNDGRYVAFVSDATNLVQGDTNGARDVFVRDTNVGGATVRVSVDGAGAQASAGSYAPAISGDGTRVAFVSYASNLVGVGVDTNGVPDVFVRDLTAGTTIRVSVSNGQAQADGPSDSPSISSDGRYVAFASAATNLKPAVPDRLGAWDIFVRDTMANTTTQVSLDYLGGQANGHSVTPSISGDGSVVAFASTATDLLPTGDTNGTWDIFVRNWSAGTPTTTRVSVSSSGSQAGGPSRFPSISNDGQRVAFYSYASNLVTGDVNGLQDVFLHYASTGLTIRVSLEAGGAEANGLSLWPSISSYGQYVAFPSAANNLIGGGDTNGVVDVFVRGPL